MRALSGQLWMILVSASLALAGCTSTGLGSPAPTVAVAPTLAPDPTAFPVRFETVGVLHYPGTARVGGTFSITVQLRNAGTKPGSPWFGLSNLTDAAPLLGCTPKCVDHGTVFSLTYLQFPALMPGGIQSYSFSFQAQRPGQISYLIFVSGQKEPLVSDADMEWSLDTTVLL